MSRLDLFDERLSRLSNEKGQVLYLVVVVLSDGLVGVTSLSYVLASDLRIGVGALQEVVMKLQLGPLQNFVKIALLAIVLSVLVRELG